MDSSSTPTSKEKEILCIEEHGEICLLLSMMLGNKVKVANAKDTNQAADYLKARHLVLVLIENSFFENTGLLYAGKLKSTLPEMKVMMISAQDGWRKEAARRAGVDIFLTKPFTKRQFLDSVVSLIH